MSTEEPTITITSSYKRVKQVAPYETSTAEVTVSEQFFGTLDAEAVANQSMSQFEVIKSEVLYQLGLPFEQDEATGRIMELFPGAVVVESHPAAVKEAPKPRGLRPVRNVEPEPESNYDEGQLAEEEPEEEPAPPRRAPRAPKAEASPGPARQPSGSRATATGQAPTRRKSQDDDEDPDGYWEALMDSPWQWWDNRASKRNPKGPDFAHKSEKKPGTQFPVGLWMNQAPSWFEDPFN